MGVSDAVSGFLGDSLGLGADTVAQATPAIVDTGAGLAAGAGLGALTSAISGGDVGQGALIGGGVGGAGGLATGLGAFGGGPQMPASAVPTTGTGGGGALTSGVGSDLGTQFPGAADTATLSGNLNTGSAPDASFGSDAAPVQAVDGKPSIPGGAGGGNSILNAIKDPSLGNIGKAATSNAGLITGLGGLGLEAIKGSQPLPQINPQIGIAQQEAQLGQQLQQYEVNGTLPQGAQAGIDQAVKSAQASIRSQYAGMGLSGSPMETEALNTAAMQGPILGFQIASQMANQGLSDLQLGSTLYKQIMDAQLQSDAEMQKAVTGFAEAAGGGGANIHVGGGG